MKFIEWNPDYELEIKIVDQQHQKLIDIINELHDAMLQRHSREKLPKILQALTDYTLIHFRTEEELMQRYNYKHKASHHDEHENFVKKVLEWKAQLEKNYTISIEIVHYLKEWLNEHILATDKDMATFLREKGIK